MPTAYHLAFQARDQARRKRDGRQGKRRCGAALDSYVEARPGFHDGQYGRPLSDQADLSPALPARDSFIRDRG